MLAQTNLQLYHQMLAAGWSEEDLTPIRAGYDVARQLFGQSYRPSHKPFVAHLIGTASALVRWEERPAIVLAGLLHSVYLYGDFGDGQRGASPHRREFLVKQFGFETEQLVFHYTNNRGTQLEQIADRDLRVLELADLLDELCDAGPAFATGKPLAELSRPNASEEIQEVARQTLHSACAEDFRAAFALLESARVPGALKSSDRSSSRVVPGITELRRSKTALRLQRFVRRIPGCRKAS